MEFSSFTTNVEEMGDGEKLLGHPTRHWRIRNTIEMNGIFEQDTFRIRMEMTGDNFYATDLTYPIDPAIAADSTMMVQFGDFIPEKDAARARSEMSRLPKTLQLKSVATIQSHTGPANMTMTTTNVVTKIESVKVPSSFFELPKRYRKIDMPSMVPPGIIQ